MAPAIADEQAQLLSAVNAAHTGMGAGNDATGGGRRRAPEPVACKDASQGSARRTLRAAGASETTGALAPVSETCLSAYNRGAAELDAAG